MEIVTTALLAVALLKIVSIGQAIRWLGDFGSRYAERLRRERPQNRAHYYEAFEESGGRHFPFGVKDYRLRRYIGLGSEARGLRWAAVTAASIFQATLYRYERLALSAGFWTIVMTSVRHDAQLFTSSSTHAVLLYALANVILGTNALLSAEAVFSYAMLGSYATSFHMLSLGDGGTRLLLEIRVVVGKVLTTVFSGAVASYVAYVSFAGLAGSALIPTPIPGAKEAVGVFLQMVYWAMTTFATVGYGDIIPANGYGQLVAFLIEVQAFAVLAIVFASLFGSKEAST